MLVTYNQPNSNKSSLRKYASIMGFSLVLGPLAIQLHEVLGHWLPARFFGAKNLVIGYTLVDWDEKSLSHHQKVLVTGGGPLVTNLLICLGLRLATHKNEITRLAASSLILTNAYRGLLVAQRQLIEPKIDYSTPLSKADNLCDESIIAKGLKINKYVISLPQAIFNLVSLVAAFRSLPGQRRITLQLTSFLGMTLGTLFYVKILGPFFWKNQKAAPVLSHLGIVETKSK